MRYYKGRAVGMARGQPGELRAAWRDASWLNSPGTARKYHVVAEDGGGACRGMPLILETVALPPRDSTVPAGSVEAHLRCQAKGCKERWPT